LGEGGAHTEFWYKTLIEGDHQGDLNINWRIILKWILKKQNMWMCTAFIWLRVEASGRLL
jgi:hypothetical protein